jgi:CTP:phosphocholine cytidylyltransferase-like protein
MPGVAEYLRTKPENTLCRNNILNLKIVLLDIYIKSEFVYLKEEAEVTYTVLFSLWRARTGSKCTHFEVLSIVKLLLRNSYILRFRIFWLCENMA